MGVWKGQTGEAWKGSLRRPLYPDIVDLYRSFKGRQLITMAKDNWPFFEVKILENNTAVPGRGIDVNIINTLGHYLNFT